MSNPKAVSVNILKGGVGKSTISVNLADRLAKRDNSTLFIDLDPNGHATNGLNFEDQYYLEQNIGDVILKEGNKENLEDIIYETDFGFDIIPSNDNLESVEDQIRNSKFPDARLKAGIVDPLLGEEYDYIVIDTPAYRGKLNDNSLVASQNLIIPLVPGNEAMSGLNRTIERQIKPLREHIDIDILAIVPNRISQRIDQKTSDRKIIEGLNRNFPELLPNFAKISQKEFEKMENGGLINNPKPGIRERKAFTKSFGEGEPLSSYDPENDQIECLDELAKIVENGDIERNR